MKDILYQLSLLQYLFIISILILFIHQLLYLIKYKSLYSSTNILRLKRGEVIPSVSVIVILKNNIDYLYDGLQELLSQVHPSFEIVVVNDCGGEDVSSALIAISKIHSNLRFTVIKDDSQFSHSRKIPLLVGIKAAKYDNVIISNTSAIISSKKWLYNMSKGFLNAEIVIGYSGIKTQKNTLLSSLIKAENFAMSINFLFAAVKGHAYRGIMYNIGYTKEIFFRHKGFTHLRLSLGEDDLFIQKIATPNNVAVIINPSSNVKTPLIENFKWWWNNKKYYSYSFKLYPKKVKRKRFVDYIIRLSFFSISIVYVILCMLKITTLIPINIQFPISTMFFIITIIAIREIVLISNVRELSKRMGEKNITCGMLIYDKIEPLFQVILSIRRTMKPSLKLWR